MFNTSKNFSILSHQTFLLLYSFVGEKQRCSLPCGEKGLGHHKKILDFDAVSNQTCRIGKGLFSLFVLLFCFLQHHSSISIFVENLLFVSSSSRCPFVSLGLCLDLSILIPVLTFFSLSLDLSWF